MNIPPSHSVIKDFLAREYDRRVDADALDQPDASDVAASIAGEYGSDPYKTEALLTDALIERGDIDPVCPDFIPAWLEGEASS